MGRGHSPLLDSVHVPAGCEYLWQIFWNLRNGLSEDFGGIKITWRDILDYQEITGFEFSAWETEAIMAMDATIAKWRADQRRET